MDNIYIYAAIGGVALIVIIAVILISKKKKNKNSVGPIHKDYDPSIANMVNNEPIKGGTFIPNDPVNPNATPMPVPTVMEPPIDNNVPDMMTNQNMMVPPMAPNPMMAEPVAPMVPNPMAPNPMGVTEEAPIQGPTLIMPSAMEMPVQPVMDVPTPIEAESVQAPIMPNLSAPIMPSLTETPATPTPVAEEVVAPVAPIMPDLMASSVEPTQQVPVEPATPVMDTPTQAVPSVVAPVDTTMAPPIDLMAPPVEPMNMNVGMVAVPLVEESAAPVVEATVVPEEPKFNVEIPVFNETPMPEIAQMSAAPVMQNTEIAPPETMVADPMSGVTPNQPKKEPMFVFDMPEEKKTDAPLHQNIELDVPDMEEMI